MAGDNQRDDSCSMPVRTIENSPPLIRPWVRWVLISLLLPAVVLASLIEYVAIRSAATGYWGPEWPTAGRDTVVFSTIWLALVGALILTTLRPIRLMWRRWRRHEVDDEDGSP